VSPWGRAHLASGTTAGARQPPDLRGKGIGKAGLQDKTVAPAGFGELTLAAKRRSSEHDDADGQCTACVPKAPGKLESIHSSLQAQVGDEHSRGYLSGKTQRFLRGPGRRDVEPHRPKRFAVHLARVAIVVHDQHTSTGFVGTLHFEKANTEPLAGSRAADD
jgi:hypothetical protein